VRYNFRRYPPSSGQIIEKVAMAVHRMTLDVPDSTYDHLRQRAAQSRRPVEVEAVEALVASVSDDMLPPALAAELEAMAALGDDSLWREAQAALSADDAVRLEALHWTQQARPLTDSERDEERVLMDAYNAGVLRRAQAMVLLKKRGHDISPLLELE
jgi:hypothetical protein